MSVSDARYFLLMGWAKYLSMSVEHKRHLDEIRKRRGNDFGIAVRDDHQALEYQRLDFRIWRAKRAVGMAGLTGYATFDGNGFRRADKETIDAMNKESFDECHRQRAYKAKKLIGDAATCSVPCKQCLNEIAEEEEHEMYLDAMSLVR